MMKFYLVFMNMIFVEFVFFFFFQKPYFLECLAVLM